MDSGRVASRSPFAVQQYSGVISGERPTRAIGAVHAGSQANQHNPRPRVAEGRHGTAVVVRFRVANGLQK